MIINPIIPVWLMGIICVFLLFLKKKGKINYIRQIFIILLLFIINLRVMVKDDNAKNVAPNVDIIFVVDNTISMLAEDYNGDGRRIDAVREDCMYIMKQFPGAAFSVVSFGDSVKRMTPYTVDTNMVIETIGLLNGQTEYYAQGTSLNEVLSEMEDILSNDRDTYKLLFFISDGEITNEEELSSFPSLCEYIDDGAVLGYGTTDGGAMKVLKYSGDEDEPQYLYYYDDDYNKRKAISKIEESNLESIAKDFDVDYIHMSTQSEIYDKINSLQAEAEDFMSEDEEDLKNGYVDIYYIFVIPFVVLLIIDYIYYRKKI